jgi:hypothetical protein
MINPIGKIELTNQPGGPRSVHKIDISDSRDLYCPPLNADDSLLLFSIACSLIVPNILFSPLQPQRFVPDLKYESKPAKIISKEGNLISIENTLYITSSWNAVLSSKGEIDETELFKTIDNLFKIRPFDYKHRTIIELNIIESLKSYGGALLAGEPLSCFKSLYISFEKMVNQQKDHNGKAFDKAASFLTGLKENDIEELRNFNNRLKHIIKNKNDYQKLKDGESNLFILTTRLKEATDKSILNCI